MTRVANTTARGFSLLETFVALAILALSMGVIYQSQIHSVRAVARGIATQDAVLLAQTLLAELTGPLPAGLASGNNTSNGIQWRVTRKPITLPSLLPEPENLPVAMLQTELVLSVPTTNGPKEIRFVTLEVP